MLRLRANRSINIITAFFFFYSIGITTIPSPMRLKEQSSININGNIKEKFDEFPRLNQESLIHKMYLDLHLHNTLDCTKPEYMTQISINKEGKILGYKPKQLRLITYSLEKQIINLLNKNVSMIKNGKSVYWLNITNKH